MTRNERFGVTCVIGKLLIGQYYTLNPFNLNVCTDRCSITAIEDTPTDSDKRKVVHAGEYDIIDIGILIGKLVQVFWMV